MELCRTSLGHLSSQWVRVSPRHPNIHLEVSPGQPAALSHNRGLGEADTTLSPPEAVGTGLDVLGNTCEFWAAGHWALGIPAPGLTITLCGPGRPSQSPGGAGETAWPLRGDRWARGCPAAVVHWSAWPKGSTTAHQSLRPKGTLTHKHTHTHTHTQRAHPSPRH